MENLRFTEMEENTHKNMCVHTNMYRYVYINCMCVYMCTHVRAHVCVCVCVLTHLTKRPALSWMLRALGLSSYHCKATVIFRLRYCRARVQGSTPVLHEEGSWDPTVVSAVSAPSKDGEYICWYLGPFTQTLSHHLSPRQRTFKNLLRPMRSKATLTGSQ